ncbi:MobQ family relaxase [Thalassospira lucentensis]|uniref:MobQ family relaxase n=1 Tax=Thalassospira lucentensis TaxID=168935 RepID=UPI003AA931A6
MAIYYLAVKSLRRGDGRNAVAAAAYRSGERLSDEREQKQFDYRRRKGVLATGISGWEGSRENLWNAAEEAERRKNSVVAREVILALPHELQQDGLQRLVEKYSEWLHARHGFAVDWAIHKPDRDGDQRNLHAHLLLTTRRVVDDTLTGKTRELDRRQTSSGHLEEWRRNWARYCNVAMMAEQVESILDHRSYERQAKASGKKVKVAQKHLGVVQTHMLRKGIKTSRAEFNETVKQQIDAERAFPFSKTFAAQGGELGGRMECENTRNQRKRSARQGYSR